MGIDWGKKVLLLALAACVVFSIFLTVIVTAQSLNHACCKTEESGCLPCLQIEAANNFFRTLKLLIFFALFAAHQMSRTQAPRKYPESNSFFLSPVALKVRFNS